MNPYSKEDLRAFIESIPPEVVGENQKQQEKENERIYNEFLESLETGRCFLCGDMTDSFEEEKPCFHWFLYPKGIKKKCFESYLQNPIGFFQLDSYFRWYANSEKPLGNINDLKEEISKTSYLETTYKYNNIEWAFSIGHTDKEGHDNAAVGSVPHYHIQMKVDGRVFLRFNDFHIPFSDSDLFTMEMFEQASDLVEWGHYRGHGMGIIEDEENLKLIDDVMTTTDKYEDGIFCRQTMITSNPGQTIPGELIGRAIDENSRTKEPIGRIMQRLLAEAEIEASVFASLSPGTAAVEMTKRSGKK